jgi:hypothetical protein
MIEIKRNRSFPGWFDVIVNGQMIDEVQGRMKALRLAKKVAHQQNIDYVMFDGKSIAVKQPAF